MSHGSGPPGGPPQQWGPPPGPGQPTGWGGPPPPLPKKSKVGPVIIGIVAFVITIGIIGAVTDGGKKQDAGSAAAPATTDAATTGEPSPSAAAATTDPPATADPGAAVSTWYSDGGETDMTAIATDLNSVSTDASASDVISMAADCATMRDDVQTAQDDPAIPDGQTQRHWADALSHFARAAKECESGATNMDTAQLLQSAGEITSGSAELGQATKRVQQLANG
jgi:hypothetical protein